MNHKWNDLTKAERRVARIVAQGYGNKGIGAKLGISATTVQIHLNHIYSKLGLSLAVIKEGLDPRYILIGHTVAARINWPDYLEGEDHESRA